MNRKARREQSRQKPKIKRRLDWNKIVKEFIKILKIILVFILILSGILFYITNTNNNLRRKVSQNSESISGTVISIQGGKFPSANYEFVVNNKKYSGSTLKSVKKEMNQNICIEYYKEDPNFNLPCNDTEIENIFEKAFLLPLKVFLIMLLFTFGAILWKILSRDKKVLTEITSRK